MMDVQKTGRTSFPLSLCSVVIHGAVLSFCGGVNGSGFYASAEPIGIAEWNYSWASSTLQTNPWAGMSALLTSHVFCCVLLTAHFPGKYLSVHNVL